MKRTIILLISIICVGVAVSAQTTNFPLRPASSIRSNPGFITINELTAGFGLGVTDVPYSKYFFGFTTVNGYQINRNFIVAGGTGLSVYNGGVLVPLFLDVRYMFLVDQFTPYLFGDAGLLLNFADFMDGTKGFLNGGAGVKYHFPGRLEILLGAGLLVQWGTARDAFVNLKAGVSYKF